MEAYKCAYRDSKSPLTPLTPMATTAFNFNSATVGNSLKKSKAPNSIQVEDFSKNYHLTPYNRSQQEASVAKATLAPSRCENSAYYYTPSQKSFARESQTPQSVTRTIQKSYECVEYNNGSTYKVSKYSEQVVKMACKVPKNQGSCYYSGSCMRPDPTEGSKLHYFRKASPVPPKSLSPRVRNVLNQLGLECYESLFENEEIDFEVFKLLNEMDLLDLGVKPIADRRNMLNAIRCCVKYY